MEDDRRETRTRKSTHVENTHIKVALEGIPRMGRVSELKPNDTFFQRRNSSLCIVVGDNCYAKDIKAKEDKEIVVIYNLSLKLITTIEADEWVVFGNKMKVEVI